MTIETILDYLPRLLVYVIGYLRQEDKKIMDKHNNKVHKMGRKERRESDGFLAGYTQAMNDVKKAGNQAIATLRLFVK